jgi:hypothetical protein
MTSFQHIEILLILMRPYSTILKHCWFSCVLVLAYECAIASHVTSFQHIEVLFILRSPLYSILMCYWFSCHIIPAYWFSCYLIPSIMICYWLSWYLMSAYWCVIDSPGTLFQLSDVLMILVRHYSSILMHSWFSCDLHYCWLAGDFILAY